MVKNLVSVIFLLSFVCWLSTGFYLSIMFLIPNTTPTVSLTILGISFFVWVTSVIINRIQGVSIINLGQNDTSTPKNKKEKKECLSCKQKKLLQNGNV